MILRIISTMKASKKKIKSKIHEQKKTILNVE
jgi:hypothetical protein